MNWKDRYTKLKVGDKVIMIAYNQNCGGASCCIEENYRIGNTYTIRAIELRQIGTDYLSLIGTNGCNHPIKNFKRV